MGRGCLNENISDNFILSQKFMNMTACLKCKKYDGFRKIAKWYVFSVVHCQ